MFLFPKLVTESYFEHYRFFIQTSSSGFYFITILKINPKEPKGVHAAMSTDLGVNCEFQSILVLFPFAGCLV